MSKKQCLFKRKKSFQQHFQYTWTIGHWFILLEGGRLHLLLPGARLTLWSICYQDRNFYCGQFLLQNPWSVLIWWPLKPCYTLYNNGVDYIHVHNVTEPHLSVLKLMVAPGDQKLGWSSQFHPGQVEIITLYKEANFLNISGRPRENFSSKHC